MEILMASILAAVIAAGMMASLIAANRITHKHNASTMAEAGGQTQQLIEAVRTQVGADVTGQLLAAGTGGWTGFVFGGDKGQELQLAVSGQAPVGQYRVDPADCDGVNGVGDCYTISVRACWDDSDACP